VVAEVCTASGLAEAMEAFDLWKRVPSPLTGEGQDGGEIQVQHHQVDILVNDARSQFAKPFTDITPEEWDTVQARNVRATFLLCQEVGRRMVRQQYGRIVNVLSGLAERGMANSAAFSASQAAVLSLTRSLAVEWGGYNIRVNALGMGWFSGADIPLDVRELLVRYIPLRRKGHPRDIGPLLVYLCSEACDYSTGQPVYVDGGLNARP
jgi:gluconate 5-dehydrogenase